MSHHCNFCYRWNGEHASDCPSVGRRELACNVADHYKRESRRSDDDELQGMKWVRQGREAQPTPCSIQGHPPSLGAGSEPADSLPLAPASQGATDGIGLGIRDDSGDGRTRLVLASDDRDRDGVQASVSEVTAPLARSAQQSEGNGVSHSGSNYERSGHADNPLARSARARLRELAQIVEDGKHLSMKELAEIAAALREAALGADDPPPAPPTQVEAKARADARYIERLALCPDHRDKATGRCIVCQAEERTRAELRAATPAPARPAPTDELEDKTDRCVAIFEFDTPLTPTERRTAAQILTIEQAVSIQWEARSAGGPPPRPKETL